MKLTLWQPWLGRDPNKRERLWIQTKQGWRRLGNSTSFREADLTGFRIIEFFKWYESNKKDN